MKAIETTATLSESGQLTLDEPLALGMNRRVRVIVLITEPEDEPDDPSIDPTKPQLKIRHHRT